MTTETDPASTPSTTSEFTWETTAYRDLVTLHAGTTLPAMWWARTMLERLMKPVPRAVVFVGTLALLPHRGPRSLAGWHIAQETPTCVQLTRRGPLMAGRLVVTTGPQAVSLGLTATPRNRLGIAVWRRVAPKHRVTAERLLVSAWKLSSQAPTHAR